MNVSTATMARPRKKKPAASEVDRETVLNLKGSPEYAAWLEEIHRKTHIPKTTIVRLALAEWAKSHGHPAPPVI